MTPAALIPYFSLFSPIFRKSSNSRLFPTFSPFHDQNPTKTPFSEKTPIFPQKPYIFQKTPIFKKKPPPITPPPFFKNPICSPLLKIPVFLPSLFSIFKPPYHIPIYFFNSIITYHFHNLLENYYFHVFPVFFEHPIYYRFPVLFVRALVC